MADRRIEEAARTLRARSERAKAKRLEEASKVRTQIEEAIRNHAPPGTRVWLIGSLAWGGFSDRSDVDVVVKALSFNDRYAFERALISAAQRKIDLLDFETLSPSFRERVELEGILISGE